MTDRRNWTGHGWGLPTNAHVGIERKQCIAEGLDISSLSSEFTELLAVTEYGEEEWRKAEALLDATAELPVGGVGLCEPSDWEGISALLPPVDDGCDAGALSESELFDRVAGAWLGRASGCLLGKPVECKKSWQIERYLKSQGRWPLTRYFSLEAQPAIAAECGINLKWTSMFEEGISCMVADDDMNYTVAGLAIIDRFGENFTPESVALFWLDRIPYHHLCTAERVTYRNLANSIPPPHSARHRNMFREWIGAQIRADFYGYVVPNSPRKAAEFAWRDACISHTKNGIYGAMWVAAMLSLAYSGGPVGDVVVKAMNHIPGESRLHGELQHVLQLWRKGVTHEDAITDLRKRWNEEEAYDWCHVIVNAAVVAMALLWGEGDFSRTICLAVMPGFDTDCNGATAGSVLGLLMGKEKLPAQWVAPLNDTLHTGINGYSKVSFTSLTRDTVRLIRSIGTYGK